MSERPSLADAIRPHAGPFSASHLPTVADIVVLVAFADLEIDSDEKAAIGEALGQVSGGPVETATVDEHIQRVRTNMSAVGSLNFAKQIGRILADDSMGEAGLTLAYAIAASNGEISEDERWRLDAIAKGAGVAADRKAAIAAKF